MDGELTLSTYLAGSLEIKESLYSNSHFKDHLLEASRLITRSLLSGGKVLVAGNGGSAGDAQHFAGELVSRFMYDRPGLAAVALTTDTSTITAISNDYGYEQVFARQLEALGNKGDVFIGISTSGDSANILGACDVATERGLHTIGLCGQKGQLAGKVELALQAPSVATPFIQECHIVMIHAICAVVEDAIFGDR